LSITDDAIRAGVARRVTSAEQLCLVASELFNDAAHIVATTDSAIRFANAHEGATNRTADLLAALLVRTRSS
jgi:3-deoxy-D-manno-octulosonic-acid transferase